MNILRSFLSLPAIIGTLPNNIANGQAVDAVPVMADLNFIVAQVNANAQPLSTTPSVLEWQPLGQAPTFISGTSFSVPGNLTSNLTVGRRLQTPNTAGTIYSYIKTSVFGGGITTVTVVSDSGALDAGLSAVNVGILNSVNVSVYQKSVEQVQFSHNTDAITTGTSFALGTTNGFTVIPGTDLFSEFNTVTGVFAPSRFGYYWLTGTVLVTITGVTFNGSALAWFATAGSSAIAVSGTEGRFSLPVTGATIISCPTTLVMQLGPGAVTPSLRLMFQFNFSAGTPVFSSGTFQAIGPL